MKLASLVLALLFSGAGSDRIVWFGVVGPAGIPKPIVQRFNEKLIQALRAPDMRIRIQAFDLWTSTPGEYTKVVRADRAKWGRIVNAAGAKVD